MLGDARGADTMAQTWLRDNGIDRVTVYHIGKKPRNKISKLFEKNGGYLSDRSRDTSMTRDSTIDIGWFRSREEQMELYKDKYKPRKSGTEKNIERRINK
jgi:hypothetical protein